MAVSIGLAAPLGIAAVQPVRVGGAELQVWNGADLALLICLAMFVAAFNIRSKESRR